MNKAIKTYWAQVHAVQKMTGATSATARRAVSALRASREWSTAKETKSHPVVVARTVRELEKQQEEPPAPPYRDLGDWIQTWEDYDGEYDYIEIETNADY